jgi:hypothetical protein
MLAHGMTELGYAPCRARTLDACLASAEQDRGERTFDLSHLTGETIMAVEPHPHGWRLRCWSGASVVVERGHTFDAAGLPVIEP